MQGLQLAIVPGDAAPADIRAEILDLCNAAYGEDLTELFGTFGPATHVLGRIGGRLVSHAMWVTRWLQPEGDEPLRTAYVEMVATHPDHQRRAYASAVMRRLVEEISREYALAALCTGTEAFYARLGWTLWRGPLAIRRPEGGLLPTPDERIMVMAVSHRPLPDLDAPLSAEWRRGELW